MTDKQIIIDVSQCPHYKIGNVCTFLSYETKCDGECSWVTYKEMEEKLKRKEQECEELKEANKHIEHNRTQKANKLKRIEEMIIACESGYTDEFIQSILAIVLEAEPIKE